MVIKDDAKLKKLNKIITKKHKIYYKCIDKNCKSIGEKLDILRKDYNIKLNLICPPEKKSTNLLKCSSKFFKKSDYRKMMNKLDKCHDICSKEEKEMNEAHNNANIYYSKMNNMNNVNNTKKNNKTNSKKNTKKNTKKNKK